MTRYEVKGFPMQLENQCNSAPSGLKCRVGDQRSAQRPQKSRCRKRKARGKVPLLEANVV